MTGDDLGTVRRLLQHLRVLDRVALACALENGSLSCLGPAPEALVRLLAHMGTVEGDVGSPGLSNCLAGWGAYYGARYEDASRCFEKAWSLPGPWASWAALGLCKVASDLGHWALARDWGLVALHLAREENDFERHSEAAGALGEVFLRAGQPKLAYELVSLDAALLPPGSGYRDRLTNYLAVCLGRLGEHSLAEPLLWHGFFAAREHDPVSAAYSRASLYVLSALIPNRSLFCRLEAGISHSVASGAELPEAIVECVRAYWGAAGTSGPSSGFERSEVLAHLERARAMLGPFYPVERAWVRELVCHVAGEPYDEAELESLRQRRSPAPPPPLRHVLDAHLADADLSTPLPFPLLGGGRSAGDAWQALRMFFI